MQTLEKALGRQSPRTAPQPPNGDIMNGIINIDRYETKIHGGVVRFYAVVGKKRILMPEAHKSMYDDQHLAIRQVQSDSFTESLFGLNPEEDYYIPLRTVQ